MTHLAYIAQIARHQWMVAHFAADFACARVCYIDARCGDRVCRGMCA